MPELSDKSNATAWLIEEWMAKLASAVEMMTEVRPTLKPGSVLLASEADLPADALWFSIPLSLTPEAALFVGASQESWLHIGQSALSAAGIENAGQEEARGTYLEIVTQSTASLAQSIAARLGASVSSLPPKGVKFGEDGLTGAIGVSPIGIALTDSGPRQLYLAWSRALEFALASSPPSDTVAKLPAQRGTSRTLDLLMEVELPVSVSFGRAELPLRDVLKLNSGSIVELNRTISDLVEIIVNNCVIARGEVVVVEGNYGVRIHEVISREERLRTLK